MVSGWQIDFNIYQYDQNINLMREELDIISIQDNIHPVVSSDVSLNMAHPSLPHVCIL